MHVLDMECPADERELLIAELWERGCTGIVEIAETRLRAFFNEPVEGSHPVEDCDWIEVARRRLQPMLVGSRFFLLPEWRDDPTPPGRLRIVVNPGLAFGTGFHETTQLCLEALEREMKPGMSVLDVGCGSGILAEAAALLGAGVVCACDTDPEAVAIARRHVPNVFAGSVDAVAAGSQDLVIANISPEAIAALAGEIRRVLRAGGTAILSGFQRGEVDAQYKNGWCAVTIRKPGSPERS